MDGSEASASIIDVESGARTPIPGGFGHVSRSGLIAVPDAPAGVTRIVGIDGTVRGELRNNAAETWISPDGARVVWLERLPRSTPSSLLSRPSRLWLANIDGSNAHPVLDLLASSLQWLNDNRRVVLPARALDGGSPGVWVVDVDAATSRVVIPANFVQAVRVSPDASRVAYLITFSGRPDQDGIWVAEIDGDRRWHVPGVGGFRWADHGTRLWRLDLATNGPDRIVLLDVETGQQVESVALDSRVLNDIWEVSPDGRALAFWRADDRQIEVFRPLNASDR